MTHAARPPQEKKERRSSKKDKHTHKKEHKHHRSRAAPETAPSDEDGAPGPPPLPRFWSDSAAAAAAADSVRALAAGQPEGAAGVLALLRTLDRGEALVLGGEGGEQGGGGPDAALSALLRRLSDALGLQRTPLPSGDVAFLKGPGQPPLEGAFAPVLGQDEGGGAEGGGATSAAGRLGPGKRRRCEVSGALGSFFSRARVFALLPRRW